MMEGDGRVNKTRDLGIFWCFLNESGIYYRLDGDARTRILLTPRNPLPQLSKEATVKKAIILAALVAMLAVPAFAQWHVDIGAEIPFRVGIQSDNEDYGEFLNYMFLVPTGTIAYNFGLGPINLGVGGKLYTLIIESVLYPIAYAELDFDPVVVNLTAGGFGFLFFGLMNSFETGALLIPELSVQFKLGKSFRLGVGAMTFIGTEINQTAFPYIAYATAKFRIPLGKKD